MNHLWQGIVTVAEREDLTPDYFKLSFDCPPMAVAAKPGQFANILVEAPEVTLRRPISFHSVEGDRVTVLVGVHGQGTSWLRERRPGDQLDLMGPLGGRSLTIEPSARRVALVGGGVGIPPLHFVATRNRGAGAPELVAFIGARTQDRLLCVEEFKGFGVDVVCSTDDGSCGFHGTAVAALADYVARESVDQVLVCGPTPMMRAAAELAIERGIHCQVSLEARMACALGACLSCVVETTTEGWQRYQRVCTEGPVFDARNVVWDQLSPLCAP
jgi:dihydroorotate dehydrogenase electron transfer subunit